MATLLKENLAPIIIIVVNIIILCINLVVSFYRKKEERKYQSKFYLYKILVLNNLGLALKHINEAQCEFNNLSQKLPSSNCLRVQTQTSINAIESIGRKFKNDFVVPAYGLSEALSSKLDGLWEVFDDALQNSFCRVCVDPDRTNEAEAELTKETKKLLTQLRETLKEVEEKVLL